MSDKNSKVKALEWWVRLKWEDKEYHESITSTEIERMWMDKEV